MAIMSDSFVFPFAVWSFYGGKPAYAVYFTIPLVWVIEDKTVKTGFILRFENGEKEDNRYAPSSPLCMRDGENKTIINLTYYSSPEGEDGDSRRARRNGGGSRR
ncbi:MAG: hypothetical protein NC112_08170 [Oxalobacter formigenes]|nr:hypothetical protein [Oxalobacter formigenes]